MSQEDNNTILDNESNLLQSTDDINAQVSTAKVASDNPYDNVPIGSGKKFELS